MQRGKRCSTSLVTVLLLMSLTGCIKAESEASSVADMETRQAVYALTRETAQEVNANSDFGGLKLLEVSTGKGIVFEPGNGAETLYVEENGENILEATYIEYPYGSAERHLVAIHIYDGNYTIFGVSIGDHFAGVQEIIEAFGFSVTRDEKTICVMEKNNTSVYIKAEEDGQSVVYMTVGVFDPFEPEDDTVY